MDAGNQEQISTGCTQHIHEYNVHADSTDTYYETLRHNVGMASDALTTKAAHKETHYHVKPVFDPSVLRCRKLTLLVLWELSHTEVGRLLEPYYSFITGGQGVHNAIRLT